jgi:HD-GYP domain-containing protein (c-di-GMP phosphodiesterase class II)
MTAGLLFLIGMYHLVLFFYHQSRRENLLFTMLCLIGSYRLLNQGDHLLLELSPVVLWDIWNRLDYMSVGLGFSLLYLFFNRIYPGAMSHKLGRWGLFLGLGHAIACAFVPVSWLTNSLIVVELAMAIQAVVIYKALLLVLRVNKKDLATFALLVSMSILLYAIVLDVLNFQGLIVSSHMDASYGYVPFVLLQWLFMARTYGLSYSIAEHRLDSFLQAMAKAIVSKSRFTGDHVERVARVSERICNALFLPDYQARQIRLGAIVHDLGKLHIPDDLLDKPGELSEDEVRKIQEHPLHGIRILERVEGLEIPRSIIRNHHENWDGTGYPDRLQGEGIPLGARIVALADFWDAVTSQRAHREAMTVEGAKHLLRDQAGKRLDPDLVDLFLEKQLWT